MRKLRPSINNLRHVIVLCLLFSIIITAIAPAAHADELTNIEKEVAECNQKQVGYEDRVKELEKQKQENLLTVQDFIYQKSIVEQQLMVLYQEYDVVRAKLNAYDLLQAENQAQLSAENVKAEYAHENNMKKIYNLGSAITMSYFSTMFAEKGKSELSNNLLSLAQFKDDQQQENKLMEEKAKSVDLTELEIENINDNLMVLEIKILSKRQEVNNLMIMIALHQNNEQLVKNLRQENEAIDNELALILAGNSVDGKIIQSIRNNDVHALDCSIQDDGIAWFDPCHYKELSSPFGMRIHPIYKTWKMHNGVDLSNKCPTQIHATRSGVVIHSGWYGGGGYTVIVDHLDGYVSQYMHLCKQPSLSNGDVVIAGDVIGCMGTTGTSTGVHLHFGLLKDEKFVDPMDYIN